MYIIKRKRKQKGQSKMDKPETLTTLDTQDTQGEGNKNTKTQHRKLKKKKHGPYQKQCICFLFIAVGKTTPATNKPTSPPTTAGSETTSDTSPTTQTATQPSTKQRQPNKTTRLLELMITPHALPHPTITPYSNETAKASENNNGSGRYTSFVTKKTKKTTSGLKISESNEIYYNSI